MGLKQLVPQYYRTYQLTGLSCFAASLLEAVACLLLPLVRCFLHPVLTSSACSKNLAALIMSETHDVLQASSSSAIAICLPVLDSISK